nr:immunoglobulin light chain junction region [Macaca mulatta]MOW31794.1 immunoglobulin light chain junction region [Macaca mulatta]MOW31816.1 immunoglobulin light chain junction region [Macaca mulatta]MOW32100.1 immunoglobulin light chain junction region [Macaca mulatta]MOW32102.1 immunoglobulin light chain junction region [Macaca mulatta]
DYYCQSHDISLSGALF